MKYFFNLRPIFFDITSFGKMQNTLGNCCNNLNMGQTSKTLICNTYIELYVIILKHSSTQDAPYLGEQCIFTEVYDRYVFALYRCAFIAQSRTASDYLP